MKGVLFILMIVVFWPIAEGQKINEAQQDSLRSAMEERMKEFRKQRAIYNHMMRTDPKRAMDSIARKSKLDNAQRGADNLEAFLSNSRADTLRKIDLSYAQLDEVPKKVFEAKDLETLILDYNHIKKLPTELGQLENLKSIYWRGNFLEDFWWISIKRLKQIEKLDLSNNTLTRVPLGIKKLESLEELILDENLFTEFPINRLARAPWVEEVDLNQNIKLEIGEGKYDKLDFLKTLKVNKCSLQTIHHEMYEMSGLEEIQFQNNQLTRIPNGINQWTNLKSLSFYQNNLVELPEDFYELRSLEIIDLYFNELEVISPKIENLNRIKTLYLASNSIYSLPETLGELTNLKELYIHRNRLSTIPEGVSKLTELKVLRVNENYLENFPMQVLELKNLEDLDVSDNEITTLPEGLEKLEKLKLFNYQQNPMNFSSPENRHIPPMISQMIESGTICVPRIIAEETQ